MADPVVIDQQTGGSASGTRPDGLPGLTRAAVFGWGLGSLGAAALYMPFIALFLRFMTDQLAISAAVAGGILALSRIVDAATDPIAGYLSDRTRSRWGRRRPYLVAGAVLASLGFVGIFHPPGFASVDATVVYLTIAVALFSLSFTLWYVPYLAMTTELTNDHNARSELVSVRVAGSSMGQLIGGAGGAALLVLFGGGLVAHGNMALTIATLGCCSMLLCVWLTRNASTHEHARKRQPRMDGLKQLWANKPFLTLAVMKFAVFLGSASIQVASAFFTRQVLKVSDSWLAAFLFISPLAMIIAVPFWARAAKRWEKRELSIVALCIAAFASLSWLIVPADAPITIMLGIMAVIGAATAGTYIMSFGMLADVLEYDTLITGQRREGALSGLITLIEKSSGACGIALTGLLLGSFGYVQSKSGGNVAQPDSAITGVYVAFAVAPAVTKLFAAYVISRYKLTRAILDDLRTKDAVLSSAR